MRVSYALLAALFPYAVCSVRRNLDVQAAASGPDPPNADRMECLRQDNLDLAGTRDFAKRFILRKVLGVGADKTESDIYVFAEQLHISVLRAELILAPTGSDEMEFELMGDDIFDKHSDVGRADVWISGFEVRTNNNLISWASNLAANREILSQGQTLTSAKKLGAVVQNFIREGTNHGIFVCLRLPRNGTIHFALSGKLRAKMDRGSWVTEMVSTEAQRN